MTTNMSFYGGRPGKPFTLTEVFGTYIDLCNDADMGWMSPIPIGDYVLIGYDWENKEKTGTSSNDNKIFNGTLWQKVYKEDIKDENNLTVLPDKIYNQIIITNTSGKQERYYFANGASGGIGYQFISETGNTPHLGLNELIVLPPNEKPKLEKDNEESGHDNTIYTFSLPRSSNYYYFDRLLSVNGTVLSLIGTDGTFLKEISAAAIKEIEYENGNIQTITITSDNNIGDYFIQKSTGIIYKVENTDNGLCLVFKAKLSITPEVQIEYSTYSYKEEETEYVRNEIQINELISKDSQGYLTSGYKFNLPKTPELNLGIKFNQKADNNTDISISQNNIEDGINYIINWPIGLQDISNFNIKYIYESVTGLPTTGIANLGDLGLVGPTNNTFSLYIYGSSNNWIKIADGIQVSFQTGDILNDGETPSTNTVYSSSYLYDKLTWSEDGKFLSVAEGTTEPSETSGQLYVKTDTKQLFYEGKEITQSVLDELNYSSSSPISSKAVSNLGNTLLRFTLPITLESQWQKDNEDENGKVYIMQFENSDLIQALKNPSIIPQFSIQLDNNKEINEKRRIAFDAIDYIDIKNIDSDTKTQIKIGRYSDIIPNLEGGLQIICILNGGKGVNIQ